MTEVSPHNIPSLYLENYLTEYETLFEQYPVTKKHLKKGEFLTTYGVINNTSYYIRKGIVHFSIGHEQGKKALNMFGPGTIFPVGVELHEYRAEYEMMIQALTDVDIYSMLYPVLKQIVIDHGEFGGELLRQNCDFMGYMLFDSVNQTFEPCLARICDILYLYIVKINPSEHVIPLSQNELASLAGASQSQMERSIQILRKEKILDTARKQIVVLDEEKLYAHCTLGMRSYT